MHPLTLGDLIDALEQSGQVDCASHSRLLFWNEQLGHLAAESITVDDTDQAIEALKSRGRLTTGWSKPGVPSGKPLQPSTIGRYIGTLQGVYKFARRHRLIRRDCPSPTQGIEKPAAPVDKNKFLTGQQIEDLITWSKVLDRQWGKMSALIVLLYHTGLRIGSVKAITWGDVDWRRETVYIHKTKNGEPIISPLTARCLEELQQLRRGRPDELIFSNRVGEPYHHRKLWTKIATAAGLPGVTPHWLRHSCGTAMAQAGLSQAQIMAQLGHKTLSASARYMHSNAEYQRQALQKVEAFK